MDTIFDCVDVSAEHDAHKADYTEAARNIHFDDTARMIVPEQLFGAVPPLNPTTWAWGQLFSKMGPMVYGKGSNKTLPADYLLSIPSQLLATNLNDHLTKANGTTWLIRAYDQNCRAVLSEGFTTIGNTEILDVVAGIVREQQTQDFKLVRPSVRADDVHIKTIWKDVRGGNYGVGVYIGNGEIGNKRLRVYPVVQKHSCTNSIIVEHDKGVEFIHRGSKASKMVIIKSVIAELFGVAAEMLDRLIEAEAETIPNFTDVLLALGVQHNWDDRTAAAVAIGTEGQDTRAGLVNGITYAAHAVERDPSEQVDMEVLGGRYLVAPASLFGELANRVRH